MLAQKEVDMKNIKMELEKTVLEKEQKFSLESQQYKQVNFKLQSDIEKLVKIIDANGDMKQVLNSEILQEQNKLCKNQVANMHKQLSQKDQEMDRLNQKIQQQEKRLAII